MCKEAYRLNPKRPKQICWFYAQGNCRYEYCRFLHENQSDIKIENSKQNIIQVTKPNQTSYVSGILNGSRIDVKIETPEDDLQKPNKPWMTKEILQIKKDTDELRKILLKKPSKYIEQEYKSKKLLYNKKISDAKRSYHHQEILNSKGEFWNIINKLLNHKQKEKSDNIKLVDPKTGQITSEPEQVVEIFNNFCINFCHILLVHAKWKNLFKKIGKGQGFHVNCPRRQQNFSSMTKYNHEYAMHIIENHFEDLYGILKQMNINTFENEDLNVYIQILNEIKSEPENASSAFDSSQFSFHYERSERKIENEIKTEKVSEEFERKFPIKCEVKIEHSEQPTLPSPISIRCYENLMKVSNVNRSKQFFGSNENPQNLNEIFNPSEFSFHYERAEAKSDIKIEREIRIKTEKVSEDFQPNGFQIKSEVRTNNQELNPPKQFLGFNEKPQHLNEIFNPSEFSFHYERAEAKTDIKIKSE